MCFRIFRRFGCCYIKRTTFLSAKEPPCEGRLFLFCGGSFDCCEGHILAVKEFDERVEGKQADAERMAADAPKKIEWIVKRCVGELLGGKAVALEELREVVRRVEMEMAGNVEVVPVLLAEAGGKGLGVGCGDDQASTGFEESV